MKSSFLKRKVVRYGGWITILTVWITVTLSFLGPAATPANSSGPLPLPTADVIQPTRTPCTCQALNNLQITSGGVTLYFDNVEVYNQSPEDAKVNQPTGYHYVVISLNVTNNSNSQVKREQFKLTDGIGTLCSSIDDLTGFAPPLLPIVESQHEGTGKLIYNVPQAITQNELWFQWESDDNQNLIKFNIELPTPIPTSSP